MKIRFSYLLPEGGIYPFAPVDAKDGADTLREALHFPLRNRRKITLFI
jgi:hypothetical protein